MKLVDLTSLPSLATRLRKKNKMCASNKTKILAEQFGAQESKCEADIKAFATSTYAVKFSLFSKVRNIRESPIHDLWLRVVLTETTCMYRRVFESVPRYTLGSTSSDSESENMR
jgi:glutathione peroxidase-family protein